MMEKRRAASKDLHLAGSTAAHSDLMTADMTVASSVDAMAVWKASHSDDSKAALMAAAKAAPTASPTAGWLAGCSASSMVPKRAAHVAALTGVRSAVSWAPNLAANLASLAVKRAAN